jgi:hypothetical protein
MDPRTQHCFPTQPQVSQSKISDHYFCFTNIMSNQRMVGACSATLIQYTISSLQLATLFQLNQNIGHGFFLSSQSNPPPTSEPAPPPFEIELVLDESPCTKATNSSSLGSEEQQTSSSPTPHVKSHNLPRC